MPENKNIGGSYGKKKVLPVKKKKKTKATNTITSKEVAAKSSSREAVDVKSLMLALRAFDRGDFSVADTIDTRALLKALRTFRNGNFSVRLPEDQVGIAGEITKTFNECVALNDNLLKNFIRVSRSVGREGRLSQRVESSAAVGNWEEYVNTFNTVLDDVVQPVNEIFRTVGSVANGVLTEPMSLEIEGRPLKGEFLRVVKVVNTMLEQLGTFASEVTRVAKEVGTDGKLGGQANVPGVGGTWKELTDNVNAMATNLTDQVRDIATVATAVAQGDLEKKITVDVKGEVATLKSTINTMVDQLSSFSSEVTRVARDVGTEGVLGGKADVKGLGGTWREITDNVNGMADNLTNQVRNIAEVATAVANGDLTKEITVDAKGEVLTLKETINSMVAKLFNFSEEVTRVAKEVGTDGRLGGQANVRGVAGTWKDLTDNVNNMASNLTLQVRDIATVVTAVAEGDLSRKIIVDVKGEVSDLKDTINAMVDRLGRFSSEVTRIAKEVGTDGILGGSAAVKGVSGAWLDLTNNVNGMASSLTAQVRDIIRVNTAVAKGDLTQKIEVDARGEIQDLKVTVNNMVDQLVSFSSEVTRVAKEVGTDGVLGGQADVVGVSGTWKELTDNVNNMATNLTNQVRNISEVTSAVAQGDLEKRITIEAKGEVQDLAETINNMADTLNSFAGEVTRVATEVGTDGKLGGQADVKGVSGTWKLLTGSVNKLADNLTSQVRDIAQVTTAVAAGDLSKKITVEAKGEVLALKETVNTMVEQLTAFSSEVTRLAREVGTDGVLGGEARVEGVSGTWLDLTNNVNNMARSLTEQVRDIAQVATAVAQGNLEQKITVDAKGEILRLKETINTMVDQLFAFSNEVTRVAREVGTEGILGGQASVPGVGGTWKDLTDNVNNMATNLTNQVRNIAEVASAVAQGDLTQRITVEARGEVQDLADTLNNMTDQLNAFSEEVTRVATEVGTEGKLGGSADVKGVAGTWKELTNSVNKMADNLTDQVRDIAEVATAVAQGNLAKKITVDAKGEILELKNTINVMVDQLSAFSSEVTRVAREVGTEGTLGGIACVEGVAGVWKDLTDNVNAMADNLTNQVRDIAQVATAVANGDLGKKITVDAQGEILRLKDTLNTMVDQLSSFSSEVTRIAREVGTEGILGGQADVAGVKGVWQDLTSNVNVMARNLTDQVRAISEVSIGISEGDLSKKITIDAKGEVLTLKDTINNMTDTLTIFSNQVTGVAREVGVEGKLGGSADVPGAKGTWRDLTDNVNELAGNLTTQVRAIADISKSVISGDFSQIITVEARGEVDDLKTNINNMIESLSTTTQTTKDQDWLKSNLTRFGVLMQGKKDLKSLSETVISELCPVINAQHGSFYILVNEQGKDDKMLKLLSGYGYKERKHLSNYFKVSEGLVGQCAFEKKKIILTDVPEDYIKINSSLGEAKPLIIVVIPILFEGNTIAVTEFASFKQFTSNEHAFLDQLMDTIGVVINGVSASARTELLLQDSQALNEEMQTQQQELKNTNEKLETQTKTLKQSEERLKNQQEELQQANEELEDKAQLLANQKKQVESKNREVEQARFDLEEKAEQLALTSKYKSEFLANMSHELRTPLNSLLILSQQLSKSSTKNLDQKQVAQASTIHEAGEDLLNLINEILDLSKIEAGHMTMDIGEVNLLLLEEWVKRNFSGIADKKRLKLITQFKPELPKNILTDKKRLQQVIKNMMSNALKFTDSGSVTLNVGLVSSGWTTPHATLDFADLVIAFEVKDTGIGIPKDKQNLIFEAFQQADGTTSRKFGGTGLGLSISREISHLLGGKLTVSSEPEQGSVFTLFIGVKYPHPPSPNGHSSSTRSLNYPNGTGEKQSSSIVDANSKLGQNKPDILDDRSTIQENDKVILVIEDDERFARILLDKIREKGFKGIVSLTGSDGYTFAQQYKPDAITLDIHLPDMSGWTLLDRLKHTSATKHIPVHIVSGDCDLRRGLKQGALAILEKPADTNALNHMIEDIASFLSKGPRQLLIVEDDKKQQDSLVELIGDGDVKSTVVGSGEEACTILKKSSFDCMVLDLRLPDMTGFDLIKKIKKDKNLINMPIIIYTGKDLGHDEETALKEVAETIIVKGVDSFQRLVDETALFLHRVEANLPESKREMLQQIHEKDPALANRKILIVDDDVRNIFAITSILEGHDVDITFAENGQEAITKMKANPKIELILMDIMMPEMDGYETTIELRKMSQFRDLPIIAVTAKAMKDDREKCIDAGCSDYITKPIDTDQLLSLIRVWLYQ